MQNRQREQDDKSTTIDGCTFGSTQPFRTFHNKTLTVLIIKFLDKI